MRPLRTLPLISVKPRVGPPTPAFRDVLRAPVVTPRPVPPRAAPLKLQPTSIATAPVARKVQPTVTTTPTATAPAPTAHADRAHTHAALSRGRLERRQAVNATEEERQEHRHLGLIAEQLRVPMPVPLIAQPSTTPPPARIDPERALAMIEKVQRYERAGRPGLQLSLGKALGGDVELERLAKGVVSVRVLGRQGPLPTTVVRQLRAALAQQGLQLGAFIEA